MKAILVSLFILISCGKTIDDKNKADDKIVVSMVLECQCSLSENKVCGKDGITYINNCVSSCYNIATDHKGSCSAPTSPKECSLLYSPVCGHNGITYSNSCIAENFGVTVYKNGSCI